MNTENQYADIINHEWNDASLKDRMPLSQRAKIFLPFAALTGYEDALQNVKEMNEKELEL